MWLFSKLGDAIAEIEYLDRTMLSEEPLEFKRMGGIKCFKWY